MYTCILFDKIKLLLGVKRNDKKSVRSIFCQFLSLHSLASLQISIILTLQGRIVE